MTNLHELAKQLQAEWAMTYERLKWKSPTEQDAACIALITAALEEVRDECAKVAENPLGPGLADFDDHWGPRIAAAIRQGAASGRREP